MPKQHGTPSELFLDSQTVAKSLVLICPNLSTPRNPEFVQLAYTPDSIWRNRDTFLRGREAIVDFLRKKWAKEGEYRLRKELFAFTDDKVCRPSCFNLLPALCTK